MGHVGIEFPGNLKKYTKVLHLNWTLGECKCCIIWKLWSIFVSSLNAALLKCILIVVAYIVLQKKFLQ